MARLGPEVLVAYHANNNLTRLSLVFADMRNGDLITTSLRCCTSLKKLHMVGCNITDEQLLQMVGAIRGHYSLEEVKFPYNRIGNAGCEALATLFEDPNCNIHTLSLANNQVSNDGAIAIAKSLTNNTKLKNLSLKENPTTNETGEVLKAFQRLLCNTTNINNRYRESRHSSINATYNSNTLEMVNLPAIYSESFFLKLNTGGNKSRVAINKIVFYHEIISDLESMLEWDSSEERTLKGLPYLLEWCTKADGAIVEMFNKSLSEPESRRWRRPVLMAHAEVLVKGKLSAIYQFARTMPLLLEPISRMEVDND